MVAMFWDAFKITFRHLWRQKLFTALNILGLAIGISACWVIYSIVSYEFSFEAGLPHKERTFRLTYNYTVDGKELNFSGVSRPVYQSVREQVTGIDRIVPVFGRRANRVSISSDGESTRLVNDPKDIVATDSSYFAMAPYAWLAGNANTALNEINQVVLTESRARTYFGPLDPAEMIGKTLIYDDTLQKTVSGIVQELPYNTEFTAQEFFFLVPEVYTLRSWGSYNGPDRVYVQVAKGAQSGQVLQQISEMAALKGKEWQQQYGDGIDVFKEWFGFIPIGEVHFSTKLIDNQGVYNKVNKPVMYGLIGVGVFLLLLACINYVNMTTAQIPQRSKEIGIRKTLGGSRTSLVRQLFRETLVTAVFASILAFVFAQLAFVLLSDSISEGAIQYANDLGALLFLVGIVLVVILLAGFYPAWLVARLQPVSILRGSMIFSGATDRFSLRKGLTVFQFVIAQLLIIGALISGAQLNHNLKADMGFDKEAVVLIHIPGKIRSDKVYDGKMPTLVEELRRETGIDRVSLGFEPMSAGWATNLYEYKGNGVEEPIKRGVSIKWVDTAYIHLYNIELVAGRNLHPSDTANEFVINETAVREFSLGTPQEAIGKIIGRAGKRLPIVGVVKDFHTRDFYSNIEPVVLESNIGSLFTLNIKLNTNDPERWQETLKTIEQKWYSIYPPETFKYEFYDESIEALYEQERSLSKLINLATTIAIIIGCLGLFGLATLTAYQRVKEIGIRKVLGSSVLGIVQLLSKDFVKLVCIAILIASPMAWWAMTKWLEDFAYRIEMQWWMFASAGMMAIVIALFTVSFQAIKAAMANPVDSLRDE